MASRVFSSISRSTVAYRLILASSQPESLRNLSTGFHSLSELPTISSVKHASSQLSQILRHSALTGSTFQRFGFASLASPQPTEKEGNQPVDHDNASQNTSEVGANDASTEATDDSTAQEPTQDAGPISENSDSDIKSNRKRRKSVKRTAFSDSDAELELSYDDLVKLVAEKEGSLKLKHKEVEKMQDKVLRSYAEMENVIDRTKREAENSKKFAIQNFAKSLLDVADNLGRASSVVKESFSKIDTSKDSAGAIPLLKTLLEGVEMTDKQLSEVFRKFGVEKYDPINEQFDPNKHLALFQVPDASKRPGTVAAVLKAGYMIYDRVLRPAEVGVTQALGNETDQSSSA
ncbi:grpE protein homolog 2, mitochondrial-like [Phoenix dactylifera]|uniref:GrpE protein homolog n=1 Tax=Phoenix dactylifera TaxID=42345 RepID=A0A8B7CGT4_PHODC|nr:grpE protein homolog 2, mitochondrial-like [Phoenix dactylifera]